MNEEQNDDAVVSYDTFAALDIRVGEIVDAKIVENADMLFCLRVDVGEEVPRQIISGIRPFFGTPQELVGKKCAFVVNLAPRVIRGYESQGMILVARHNDTLALLAPHTDVPAGTHIS